jgi:hypothetical protein
MYDVNLRGIVAESRVFIPMHPVTVCLRVMTCVLHDHHVTVLDLPPRGVGALFWGVMVHVNRVLWVAFLGRDLGRTQVYIEDTGSRRPKETMCLH